jgi:hypothetical protein
MHVRCPDQCCMIKSILCVHVHAACLCPYCMSMSICISMSMLMMHFHVNVYVHIYRNAGLSEIRPVRYRAEKKLTMPEQVWYRTKLTQSGIFLVWYQTKIRDAVLPMPALVSSMPMPSCAAYIRSYAKPFLPQPCAESVG